jgi:hypothetical protein
MDQLEPTPIRWVAAGFAAVLMVDSLLVGLVWLLLT